MPPDQNAQDPHDATSKPVASPVNPPVTPVPPAPPPVAPQLPKTGVDADIAKILLPKKEVPGTTVQSAQRINAGALLAQEQLAGSEGLPKVVKPSSVRDTAAMNVEHSRVSEAVSPTKPIKKEEGAVRSLETYQGDIERLVQDKNVSVLSIAAAEAGRRGQAGAGPAAEAAGPKTDWAALARKWSMVALSVVLVATAVGALAFIFLRPTSTGPAQTAGLSAPFISVDDTKIVNITQGETHANLMAALESQKEGVALSLGLIARLLPSVASTTPAGQTTTPLEAQTFLPFIAPHIPADFLRTIEPQFLLGVHIYNDNQAFLILRADSYAQAYSGLLAWEPDMQRDLAPLFNYMPRAHIPEEGLAATTSDYFVQTGFIDKIVENHDARVIVNQTNDVVFMWTFIDRNTILITTNDATLREVITRLQNAPITPIPGQ